MKVQFQRPEIIDISPEGEGWRFVVQKFQKRQHDVKYKVADECPIPDPDDINDALENALYLESAVNGMKLGVRVKCGLQVSREGSLQQESNLEIIADTGSEEDDLISHSDLEVRFKDKAKKIPSSPVSLITANGPVDAEAKHEVYIESLKNPRRTSQCPSGVLRSKKCMEQVLLSLAIGGGALFHLPQRPEGHPVVCIYSTARRLPVSLPRPFSFQGLAVQQYAKGGDPLPLAFVLWLETELVFDRLSQSEAVFAGSVLLCIWCSLRFSDAQHVRLEQFFIDFDSIRSISYRTKSRKFMPFGCISGGLYRLPSNHFWLFHWLSAMEHTLELNASSAAAPDYIFFGFDGESVRPLSYAEALVRLRRLLDMWGGITSLQTFQYTLHRASYICGIIYITLYGRDDVSPLIIAQDLFIQKVLQGWRARTPMMRGVTFMPCEPPLSWAPDLSTVSSIPDLAFFRFSQELDRSVSGTSPLAVPSASVHSETVSELPSAPSEIPREPPLEGETSSGSGEDPGAPEEIAFLSAESSCILHAGIEGRPACGAGGRFVRFRTRPQFHAPVTPMENIREPQSLKDSIIFLYDTDVHQLASFIRSGPPLGRTKLMLALGLSFQAPGTRISGPAASGQSIPPKQAEKVEKKVVEEDPPSSSKGRQQVHSLF
eukprot:s3520_g13.t1